MDSREFIDSAERDAVLIDALHHALYAMALTTGCTINQAGVRGSLHFDYEIAKLRLALYVLGIDTTQQLPPPCRRT